MSLTSRSLLCEKEWPGLFLSPYYPCSLDTSWKRWSVEVVSCFVLFLLLGAGLTLNISSPQVCGSPDIPLHLLKSVATYKGVEPTSSLIQWFWEVMESFSNTERSLFLRFVWGRTRLPRTIADFRGRDFVVQVRKGNETPKRPCLPESVLKTSHLVLFVCRCWINTTHPTTSCQSPTLVSSCWSCPGTRVNRCWRRNSNTPFTFASPLTQTTTPVSLCPESPPLTTAARTRTTKTLTLLLQTPPRTT